MDKVLIDTDVLLDFFFNREPFASDAAKVLSLCELKKIEGYITPVICSNLYYLLRKVGSHEKVIEKLSKLLTITAVLPINKEVIIKSLNSRFKDFEDALQNYAAENSNEINIILTRNTKDFKNSKLAIISPENYLAIKSNTVSTHLKSKK